MHLTAHLPALTGAVPSSLPSSSQVTLPSGAAPKTNLYVKLTAWQITAAWLRKMQTCNFKQQLCELSHQGIQERHRLADNWEMGTAPQWPLHTYVRVSHLMD